MNSKIANYTKLILVFYQKVNIYVGHIAQNNMIISAFLNVSINLYNTKNVNINSFH